MISQNVESIPSSVGRLIAKEESASDLLALLVELDSKPIAEILNLDAERRYEAIREFATGNGRLDLVIIDRATDIPAAVIEMKGAADPGDDQLDRYLAWANSKEPRPKVFLCAFDEDESVADPEWTRCRLRDIYAGWCESSNRYAAWLAQSMVSLLEQWDQEADAPLGDRTGYYVPDVLTKRLAREVKESIADSFTAATYVEPNRDNGGNPMVLAWAAHPRDPEDLSVAVGVDLRSPGRRSKSTIWKLRPNIAVDTLDDRDLGAARQLAFGLAAPMYSTMGHENIMKELVSRGQTKVARALIPRPNDGLNTSVENFNFEEWARQLAHETRYPRGGLFYHDKGKRLASVLYLDVTELTRIDLVAMATTILEVLHNAAQQTIA